MQTQMKWCYRGLYGKCRIQCLWSVAPLWLSCRCFSHSVCVLPCPVLPILGLIYSIWPAHTHIFMARSLNKQAHKFSHICTGWHTHLTCQPSLILDKPSSLTAWDAAMQRWTSTGAGRAASIFVHTSVCVRIRPHPTMWQLGAASISASLQLERTWRGAPRLCN